MKKFIRFVTSSRPIALLVCEILAGIMIVFGSSLLFADITKDTLFDQEVTVFDTNVSHFVYSLRTTELTKMMIVTSYFGLDIILVVATVIAIFLTWEKHKKESILFIIMLGFGAVLNLLLKEFFQRPRPTIDPLFTLTSYSFPSTHAMYSFVFYATFSYFVFHYTRNVFLTIAVSLLSCILVLLIGLSRVYLGVHYPTDIIAGYVAGLLWFVFVLLVDKTLVFSNLFRKYRKFKKEH